MARSPLLWYVQGALICGAALAASAAAQATNSPTGACALSKTQVANILGNAIAPRKLPPSPPPGHIVRAVRPALCAYHAATPGGISAVVGRIAPADLPRVHTALVGFGPRTAIPKSMLRARSPEQYMDSICSAQFGLRRATAVHDLGDRACTVHNQLYVMNRRVLLFFRVSGTSEAEAVNLERDLALAEIIAGG